MVVAGTDWPSAMPTAAIAPAPNLSRRRFFLRTLWRRPGATLGVVLVSFALSVVPAVKSGLESSVISAIDATLRQQADGRGRGGDAGPTSLDDALEEPIGTVEASGDNPLEKAVTTIAAAGSSHRPLGFALIVYGGVVVLAFAFGWLATALRALLTRDFFTELRRAGMRTLMDPRQAARTPAEKAAGGAGHGTTVTQGAMNVAGGYAGLLQMFQYAFAIVTTGVLLYAKSPDLFWTVGAIVAVQASIMAVKTRLLRRSREALEARRDEVVGRSDDIIDKRDVIAAHEQGPRYAKELQALAGEYGDCERRLSVRDQVFRGLSTAVMDAGRIGVLVVALALAVRPGAGSQIASIGDAYFILAIYLRMLSPVQSLLQSFDDYWRSRAVSKRFQALLATPPAAATRPASALTDAPDAPTADGRVDAATLEGVTLLFPAADGAERGGLRECSLRIPAGRTTLIVGRSGSGKTTIARLLLGFQEPQEGVVRVLGRDVRAWEPRRLLEHMSYMAQGDHVVHDTVRANLFAAGRTDDELIARLAALRLPSEGTGAVFLDRQAGPLSTGEQQRVALARVMLDDDPIVLLDEPLSGVDAFTFRDVSPHLETYLRGGEHTIVLISHRLAFAAYVDHVVVLEAGRVVDQGPLETLRGSGGPFQELYDAALRELVPAGAGAGAATRHA
jgi:ABC-type multidrug transport system fused ATPase/permease subunit